MTANLKNLTGGFSPSARFILKTRGEKHELF